MSGISFGAATDYVYGLAQAAVEGVTVFDQDAVAVDGWPTLEVPGMFVVGIDSPPPGMAGQTVGTQQWTVLGGPIVFEDFTVPCYICVFESGTSQKLARDEAEGIFQTFWAAFAADRSLGGVLIGGGATVANLTSVPMNVGSPEEPGRRQLITFSVRCTSLHD